MTTFPPQVPLDDTPIGDPYFTAAEFRAQVANLATSITDADIEALCASVESVFERAAGRAFTLRQITERLRGDGTDTYIVGQRDARTVLTCTVDSVAVEASIDEVGMLRLPAAAIRDAAISVEYTYGMDPAPAQLKRLALLYAESIVGAGSIDARATGQQSEFGYIKYSVAGRDGATGIPEVDAFLSRSPAMGGYGVCRHVIA